MQRLFLAGLMMLSTLPSVSAQDGRASPALPRAPLTGAQQDAVSTAQGAEARRKDEERRKRWDERMRRTARSVCDRC